MDNLTETTWLRPVVTRPDARIRLLCFPPAGGGRTTFQSWSTLLPIEVEPWVVCLPGREDRLREQPSHDLRIYANVLAEIIYKTEDVKNDSRYVFCGHSFGALLAFETAHILRQYKARGPFLTVLSGYRAPHRQSGRIGLHNLPRPALIAELQRLWEGADDRGVLDDNDLIALVEPALRADLACCAGYQYQVKEPLQCAVTICGGNRDPLVPREDLLAWRELVAGPCRARIFAGGHFFIVTQQRLFLQLLARDIAAVRVEKGSLL